MGCKVVCSDIPVLREVNPRAEFVDFGNKPLLEQKVNTLLSQPENPDVLRKATESFSSPKTFISNLNVIIHELEK